MKYLLAGIIIYNDEDGSLSLTTTPDEEKQILTCTGNTILKILVRQHGNVVERETFLREVWDDRGLQGSNNSLNQYISILRKMLFTLVPDALFIVTVPKTGFMLSADVPVQPLDDAPEAEKPAKKPFPLRFELLFCALLTLVVVALCTWVVVTKDQKQEPPMHLLTHFGECPVYTFAPLADVFHTKAIRLAESIQRDGNFPCLHNSVFYLHIQDALFYGDEGRVVLSQCSHTGGEASACRTLYYYEWLQ